MMHETARIELQHFTNMQTSADYRFVCANLYGLWNEYPINPEVKLSLAGEMGKGIAPVTRQINRLPAHWLENNTFTRRYWVNPQLFLCALSQALSERGCLFDFDSLMSDSVRQRVCEIAMLDQHGFDRCLSHAEKVYPELLRPGTTAGSYGRFTHLYRQISPKDFIEESHQLAA